MDLSDIEIAYEYGEGDEAEFQEIDRNVRTIVTTQIGTCPLYRDFGVNPTFLDQPMEIAQNLMAVEIIDAVEKWEPRAIVKDVSFTTDISGKLKGRMVIAHG